MVVIDSRPEAEIPEFEQYLDRVQQHLGLSAEENLEVVEELRGHLHQQYQELLRQGHPVSHAISDCLEQMGNGDHLANRLTTANRWTQLRARNEWFLFAAICLILGLVMVFQWWPRPRDLTVQFPELGLMEAEPSPSSIITPSDPQQSLRQLESPIGQRIPAGLSLSSFLDRALGQNGLAYRIDHQSLLGQGREAVPPMGAWHHPESRLRTVLDLILNQRELGWELQDGIVMVQSLSHQQRGHSRAHYQVPLSEHEWESLITVIRETVEPDSWEEAGQSGSDRGQILHFGKQIIVKNNLQVHQQLSRLLDRLEVPWKSTGLANQGILSGSGGRQ